MLGVAHGEAHLSGTTASQTLKEFAASSSTSPPNNLLDELSERERDILKLLAAELTNKEIGCRLIIAKNTVKNHLKTFLQTYLTKSTTGGGARAKTRAASCLVNPSTYTVWFNSSSELDTHSP